MATERMDLIWDEVIEPDIRAFHIRVAKDVLAEEQRKGFDPNPRTIVDGHYDERIEGVEPFGRIEFVSRSDIGEIALWIFQQVVEKSPVLTGKYSESHLIMVNGKPVSESNLVRVGMGDQVQIVNTRPYARKIEGGGTASKPSQPPQSMQAPNGVYRVVWRAARRKYGKNAFIDFKWVRLEFMDVEVMAAQGGRSKGVRHDRARKRVLKEMVYPAITIFQGAA